MLIWLIWHYNFFTSSIWALAKINHYVDYDYSVYRQAGLPPPLQSSHDVSLSSPDCKLLDYCLSFEYGAFLCLLSKTYTNVLEEI